MNKDFLIKNQTLALSVILTILFWFGFLIFDIDVLYIVIFFSLFMASFTFINLSLKKDYKTEDGQYFKNEKHDFFMQFLLFPFATICLGFYGFYANPTGDNSPLNYFYYLFALPSIKGFILLALEIKQRRNGIKDLSTTNGSNSGYFFFVGGLNSIAFFMLGSYWIIFIFGVGKILEEVLIYIYKDSKEKEPENKGILKSSLGYYFDTRINKFNKIAFARKD